MNRKLLFCFFVALVQIFKSSAQSQGRVSSGVGLSTTSSPLPVLTDTTNKPSSSKSSSDTKSAKKSSDLSDWCNQLSDAWNALDDQWRSKLEEHLQCIATKGFQKNKLKSFLNDLLNGDSVNQHFWSVVTRGFLNGRDFRQCNFNIDLPNIDLSALHNWYKEDKDNKDTKDTKDNNGKPDYKDFGHIPSFSHGSSTNVPHHLFEEEYRMLSVIKLLALAKKLGLLCDSCSGRFSGAGFPGNVFHNAEFPAPHFSNFGFPSGGFGGWDKNNNFQQNGKYDPFDFYGDQQKGSGNFGNDREFNFNDLPWGNQNNYNPQPSSKKYVIESPRASETSSTKTGSETSKSANSLGNIMSGSRFGEALDFFNSFNRGAGFSGANADSGSQAAAEGTPGSVISGNFGLGGFPGWGVGAEQNKNGNQQNQRAANPLEAASQRSASSRGSATQKGSAASSSFGGSKGSFGLGTFL